MKERTDAATLEKGRKFISDSMPAVSKTENSVPVLIDEVNDPGKIDETENDKSVRTFGYGIAILHDPDRFKAVSEAYKKWKGIKKELKLRKVSDPGEKNLIAEFVRISGAELFGTYFDKTKDLPDGYYNQDGSDNIIGMLYGTLEMVLPKIPFDYIEVIVDHHPAYDKEGFDIGRMSRLLSETFTKTVNCRVGRKKSDTYSLHLQTADAVSHAVHRFAELGIADMSSAMGQKIVRLGRNDSIRRRGV
jgi:hypothetical protein